MSLLLSLHLSIPPLNSNWKWTGLFLGHLNSIIFHFSARTEREAVGWGESRNELPYLRCGITALLEKRSVAWRYSWTGVVRCYDRLGYGMLPYLLSRVVSRVLSISWGVASWKECGWKLKKESAVGTTVSLRLDWLCEEHGIRYNTREERYGHVWVRGRRAEITKIPLVRRTWDELTTQGERRGREWKSEGEEPLL